MAKAVIRREPLTYERRGPNSLNSYFRDLISRGRDTDARDRLIRHAGEMDKIAAARETRAWRNLERASAPGGPLAGLETRVTPGRTQGQGGYFVPPLWLNQAFTTAPRPGRILAGLIPPFDLPAGVQSVNAPRITTGTATGSVADTAADAGTDFVDAATTARVATISGQAVVSLQLLEQSPAGAHLDWALFQDLALDYDTRVETQLLTGTGSGSTSDIQLQGIVNLAPAGNQVTYTSGSPAFTTMYPLIGQTAARVGNNRKLPPELWLMTTSRWSWIGTSEDSSLRPIAPPDMHAPTQDTLDGQTAPPVSSMLGWPVFCDDAIPANLGAGANQDLIVACRPSDMILLEAEPRTIVADDVLSGTLGVRLIFRNYVAALTGRYPTGTATLQGTGMTVATGF